MTDDVTRRVRPAGPTEARIAELLLAGHTYAHIRDVLGRASYGTISAVRKTWGIPVPSRRGRGRTPEETYTHHATPAPDGHAYWTGAWSGRMPTIYLPDGRKTSALRIAFRLAHGRDPEGNATRTCGNLRCVAAAHLADRPMRLKKETGQ